MRSYPAPIVFEPGTAALTFPMLSTSGAQSPTIASAFGLAARSPCQAAKFAAESTFTSDGPTIFTPGAFFKLSNTPF